MKIFKNLMIALGALIVYSANAQHIEKTWTVQVVKYQTDQQILDTIVARKIPTNQPLDSIISQSNIAILDTPEVVTLVAVSGEDLGLYEEHITYSWLCAAAAKFHLRPCMSDMILPLRLAYRDQPLGEWLYLAAEPIQFNDGYGGDARCFLSLVNNGIWKNGILGVGDRQYFPSKRIFIFQKN
jgi:hypothetical protein